MNTTTTVPEAQGVDKQEEEKKAQAKKLRGLFGQFASGVTVVTVDNDGTPHGATVTAFTAISVEPRLIQVTLTKKSRACQFLANNNFAVNMLASDQVDTAMHFAGRPQDHPVAWHTESIAPALDGCLATLWCKPWAQYDGGDHTIFIGEIVDAVVNDTKSPCLFFRSTFHELGAKSHESSWSFSADDPQCGWFGATATLTPF